MATLRNQEGVMIKAKSTPPGKSNTKKKRKNDDLGDDTVKLSTANPPPSDPTKPPAQCDDPSKYKDL